MHTKIRMVYSRIKNEPDFPIEKFFHEEAGGVYSKCFRETTNMQSPCVIYLYIKFSNWLLLKDHFYYPSLNN